MQEDALEFQLEAAARTQALEALKTSTASSGVTSPYYGYNLEDLLEMQEDSWEWELEL